MLKAFNATAVLNSKAFTQIFWVISGLGASQGLRLFGNLILTRMLSPDEFGLLAIATSILVGVSMMSDVGLGGAVIKSNNTAKPGYMETVWTLSALRGLGIGVLLILLSYPISLVYDQPELAYIISIYCVVAILGGCSSTNIWLYDKKLQLRKRVFLEISGQAVSIVVMITWAYFSPNYWALVAGAVANALVYFAFSHVIYRGYKPGIRWDKEAVSEIFHYGKWVFLATAATFLSSQGDRLLLGAWLDISQLGIYAIAATFASLSIMIINKVAIRVLQPLFKQYYDKNRLDEVLKTRSIVNICSSAVCIAIAVYGDLIIAALYDERYIAAGWMLQLLAVRGISISFAATITAYVNAIGYPKANFRYEAVHACVLIGGLTLGAQVGITGMILAYAVAPFLCLPILAFAASKKGLHTFKSDLTILIISITVILVGWMIRDSEVLSRMMNIFS